MYKILIDNKIIDFNLISEEDYNNSKELLKNKIFIYGWFLVNLDGNLIPKYIGQTITGSRRWYQERTRNQCKILYNGIKKYKEKLKPFIIEFTNKESLNKLERHYYDFFKTAYSLGGYNITVPETNRREEPSVVKKIKQLLLQQNLTYTDISQLVKASVSYIKQINLGTVWFEQTLQYPLNSAIYGHHKADSIVKENELVCYYDKHGNLIKTFNTISDAVSFTGVCYHTIHNMIKNNYGYFRSYTIEQIRNKIEIVVKKKSTLKVIQYSAKGEYIADFPSIKAASKATGIKREVISACIKQKDNLNCDGRFIWILNNGKEPLKKLPSSKIKIKKKLTGKFGGFTLKQFKGTTCIATYKSINEASRALNVNPHKLKKFALEGTIWNGYIFKLK